MTPDREPFLWVIGAGKMGCAMALGWLEDGFDPGRIRVQDPQPSEEAQALFAKYDIAITPEIRKSESSPSVVVLAVKPQIMDKVLPGLRDAIDQDTLLLSIAAGRTIDSLARHFSPSTAIIRSMPNTPASIGRGITVCVANGHVSDTQKSLCSKLLGAIGEVAWLDDENLMDAVTAVSGSGPAYIFHMAEALTAAGIAAGLDEALATRLARATISGAGEMLHLSDESTAKLRENVTSPGGTTAAALDVLMADPGLTELLTRAVKAATARSKELAE